MSDARAFVLVNMNDTIRYKLTARGMEILRRQHEEARSILPRIGEFEPPMADPDGWVTDGLWHFMQTFGSFMEMGAGPHPTEPWIQIEARQDLREKAAEGR